MRYQVIRAVGYTIGGVAGATMIALRFRDPDMAMPRFLLTHWPLLGILVLIVLVSVAVAIWAEVVAQERER